MTWLLTQMWALLGAAALIALILGWSLRGVFLRGRLRRAEVESGLARTELEQARTEIEGLYAAQRKLSDGGPELRADLDARDQHISALNDQILSMKSELDSLRSESGEKTGLGAGVAGAAGAVAGALVGSQFEGADPEELMAARARIQDLEETVSGLESQLSQAQAASATAIPAAPVATTETSAADGVDTVEADKLRWQNDYLRTRLKVFEQRAGVQLSGEPPAGPDEVVDTALAVTDQDSDGTDPQTDADDRETPDEELARLRWRNRYLEGRLAYLEEERSKDAPEFEASVPAGLVAAAATAAAVSQSEPHVEAIEADQGPEQAASAEATEEVAPNEDTSSTSLSEASWDDVSEPLDEASASADAPADAMAPMVEPAAVPVEAIAETPEMPAEVDPEPQAETTVEAETAAPAPDASVDITPERPVAMDEPSEAERDDLTQIEGVGPRIQDVLHTIGVFRFEQIAAWTPANQAWVDDYLSFSGRVARENWVEQAETLAKSPTPAG
ncbi:MAG: hypothetical protein AAFR33_00665 [Pseudomonadota bacterium]